MSNLLDHAKSELARINFGDEDTVVMLDILDTFFKQWDSGGAVSAVAPILRRLLAAKPLTKLTGAPSEWYVINAYPDADTTHQNIRCSTVFLRANGTAYNISSGKRVDITFPYWVP